MQIIKYSPEVADLKKLATSAKKVVIKGIDDKEGIALAEKTRKELVKMRGKINNQRLDYTKGLREEVTRVNELGKKLVAIIEPEELRIKEMEAEVKKQKQFEERKVLLPTRKQMLKSIDVKMTDEEILGMDEKQFSEKYAELQTEYEERQKAEKERKQAILKAKKDAREAERKRKEKELLDAKLAGCNKLFNSFITLEQFDEYEENWEMEEDQNLEEAKRNSFDASKAMLKNKIKQEEEKKKEDEEKRLKNKRYQEWLRQNNFDGETMVLKQTDTEIIMYQIISTFKK